MRLRLIALVCASLWFTTPTAWCGQRQVDASVGGRPTRRVGGCAPCGRIVGAVEDTASSIVSELAGRSPRAARVFSLLGIDYCCNGGRSLREAAVAANIRVSEVLDLIARRPRPDLVKPANEVALPLITEYIIEHHHHRARSFLTDLLEMIDRILSGHAANEFGFGRLKVAIEQLARDLIPHMTREEAYLFPYIDTMDRPVGPDQIVVVPLTGSVEYPLQSIRHDHSDDTRRLAEIREMARAVDPRTRTCSQMERFLATYAEFDRDLTEHIDLENHVLFPRAVELEQVLMKKRRVDR